MRYWETEFEQLRPQKNRAGNRIYNEKDIDVIRAIQNLLRLKRFTIDGAKEHLKTMQFDAKALDENREENNQPDTPFADIHTNGISPETLIDAPILSSTLAIDHIPTPTASTPTVQVRAEQVPKEQVQESAKELQALNIPLQETDFQNEIQIQQETHPFPSYTFSQTTTRDWEETLEPESFAFITHPLSDSHKAEERPTSVSDNSIVSDSSNIATTQNAPINSLSQQTSTITLSREELLTIRDTLRSVLHLLSVQPVEHHASEAFPAERKHSQTKI